MRVSGMGRRGWDGNPVGDHTPACEGQVGAVTAQQGRRCRKPDKPPAADGLRAAGMWEVWISLPRGFQLPAWRSPGDLEAFTILFSHLKSHKKILVT